MTSVASFYFASRAATTTATAPLSKPTLVSVAPAEASKAADRVAVPVKISGTDLQLARTVRFEMGGGNAVLATDVSSNDQSVQCHVTLEPGLASGKYDVIVTNGDGATAKLPGAFEVRQPSATQGGQPPPPTQAG
jgi:hypothetical protein